MSCWFDLIVGQFLSILNRCICLLNGLLHLLQCLGYLLLSVNLSLLHLSNDLGWVKPWEHGGESYLRRVSGGCDGIVDTSARHIQRIVIGDNPHHIIHLLLYHVVQILTSVLGSGTNSIPSSGSTLRSFTSDSLGDLTSTWSHGLSTLVQCLGHLAHL